MSFKKILEEKGFSNTTLAEKAAVGESTVSQLANEKRKEIRLSTAKKLATALSLTTDELYSILQGE